MPLSLWEAVERVWVLRVRKATALKGKIILEILYANNHLYLIKLAKTLRVNSIKYPSTQRLKQNKVKKTDYETMFFSLPCLWSGIFFDIFLSYSPPQLNLLPSSAGFTHKLCLVCHSVPILTVSAVGRAMVFKLGNGASGGITDFQGCADSDDFKGIRL